LRERYIALAAAARTELTLGHPDTGHPELAVERWPGCGGIARWATAKGRLLGVAGTRRDCPASSPAFRGSVRTAFQERVIKNATERHGKGGTAPLVRGSIVGGLVASSDSLTRLRENSARGDALAKVVKSLLSQGRACVLSRAAAPHVGEDCSESADLHKRLGDAHTDEATDRLRFRQDDRHPDALLLRITAILAFDRVVVHPRRRLRTALSLIST